MWMLKDMMNTYSADSCGTCFKIMSVDRHLCDFFYIKHFLEFKKFQQFGQQSFKNDCT